MLPLSCDVLTIDKKTKGWVLKDLTIQNDDDVMPFTLFDLWRIANIY